MFTPDEFEELVAEALEEIPEEFRSLIENVEVAVEKEPDPALLKELQMPRHATLFGLYQGIPRPQRTVFQPFSLPDRITIYRLPILRACRTRETVIRQVKKTVIHEVAHHFGISDRRLRELGY